MKKIKVSSKLSFIISIITSIIFVLYFAYKGFMVYFVQKAMDDTFVGGNTSDITVTLWFGISVAMALSMFLFFQFTKIQDLNSQRTIQKGIFIGWAIIALAMIIFIPSPRVGAFRLVPKRTIHNTTRIKRVAPAI